MAKERLYILMRTDMASGTPGKMMAQASHASNAFVKRAFDVGEDISGWTNQTDQGFGTVIVLDGGNINDIRNSIDILYRNGYVCDVLLDPTYPLVDGNYTHLIPVETCAYVYVHELNEQFAKMVLSKYELHN